MGNRTYIRILGKIDGPFDFNYNPSCNIFNRKSDHDVYLSSQNPVFRKISNQKCNILLIKIPWPWEEENK